MEQRKQKGTESESIEEEVVVMGSAHMEDGMHKGIIVAVNYRTEPHKYHDIVIQPDEFPQGITLKVSFSSYVSDNSQLGELIKKFGSKLTVGNKLLISSLFINKRVSFLTMKKKTDRGEFVNIVRESLKPEVV